MKPPAWLADLQSGFSMVLRSPLSSESGTFVEDRATYAEAFVRDLADSTTIEAGRIDRLALYHRQYWMRLFTVLQGQYPRFAWALGHFHFNRLASLYLSEQAPRGFDIEDAGSGLSERLRAELVRRSKPEVADEKPNAWQLALRDSGREHRLLNEALIIDLAERRVFLAPSSGKWMPTPQQIAALPERRLQYAAGFALISEHWDLAPHSGLFRSEPVAQTVAAPHRLERPRCWVFYRTVSRVSLMQVSGEQGSFLAQCRRLPLGTALQALEASATAPQLELISRELNGWIRQAIELGWWTGAR